MKKKMLVHWFGIKAGWVTSHWKKPFVFGRSG